MYMFLTFLLSAKACFKPKIWFNSSECSNLYNAVKNSFNQPFYPGYKGVFMGILRAVSYLQTKGILYNDIEPNNIAVQSVANNNIVGVLIDFGKKSAIVNKRKSDTKWAKI